MNYYEKCQEIIRLTNDGDDLAPADLKLTELILNATPYGVPESMDVAFNALYENVKNGYKKPWFHGVENLTQDHAGYVLWRDIIIEHYDFFDDSEGEKEAVIKLGAQCVFLEAMGLAADVENLARLWDWLCEYK